MKKFSFFKFSARFLFVILAFLFTPSCSDDSTGPKVIGDGGPFGPDKTTYDVEYNDNVILLTGEKKKAFISKDSTGVNYSFDASLMDEPQPGSVIVVEGLCARKVFSVQNMGGQYLVETSDAALTDVIKNGKISWDFTPTPELIQKIEIKDHNNKSLGVTEKREFTYSMGNWDYKLSFDNNATSENGLMILEVAFLAVNKVDEEGKITATFSAKGQVRIPRQQTEIEIQNSQLTKFNTNNKGIKATLALEILGECSMGGGHAEISFPSLVLHIPLQSLTTLPIPIPIYINFGVDFHTYVNIPSASAIVTLNTNASIDSETGFEFNGPKVETKNKVNDHVVRDNPVWDILEVLNDNIEVRYDVVCPHVGIEILGQEVAYVGAVLSCGSSLRISPLCKGVFTQVMINGGYKFEILGSTMFGDDVVFFQKRKELVAGDCE